MKLSLCSCILAGLSTLQLASATTTTPTGTRLDDFVASATPYPKFLDGGHPNLDLRQNLGVNPGVVTQPAAGAQIPPVTVYSIVSQVGATGVQKMVTYTQVFPKFPDPFPKPVVGTVGYGTDKQKRAAEPTPNINTGYVDLPLVLEMQTVMVTQPIQRVTDVLVVQTVSVRADQTRFTSGMPQMSGNRTLPASLGTVAYWGLRTGSA